MLNNQKELILLEDLGYLFPKEDSKTKRRYGVFKCYCGKEFKALIPNVKIGHTKSCGCLHIKSKRTHGLTKHRLYDTWNNMMKRCYVKTNNNYASYGGRGITVCDEWKNTENFINDMYSSYKEGLTLDRENNNLGYSKDNCRWVNQKIQSRNTRVLRINNSSGYRGVCWHKATNKFIAKITVNLKSIYLGLFTTALEGAKAYDKYIIDNNLEHTKNF